MAQQPGRLNANERERLILQHYPMVRRLAYRMVSRYPSCVEADDLIAIGTLGLIDAVDRFEHTRSESFAAYARIRVQGAIVDELRKADWVPRSVRDRNHRISYARQELEKTLGREPSDDEVAQKLEVDVQRLRSMERDATLRTLVSMEESNEGEDSLGNMLASPDFNPLEDAVRHRVRQSVQGAMGDLQPRERLLVELYYFRDMTFKEIGEVLGVTESRVSQLHSRVKARLLSRLQSVVENDG